jgi:hypothetical protein
MLYKLRSLKLYIIFFTNIYFSFDLSVCMLLCSNVFKHRNYEVGGVYMQLNFRPLRFDSRAAPQQGGAVPNNPALIWAQCKRNLVLSLYQRAGVGPAPDLATPRVTPLITHAIGFYYFIVHTSTPASSTYLGLCQV